MYLSFILIKQIQKTEGTYLNLAPEETYLMGHLSKHEWVEERFGLSTFSASLSRIMLLRWTFLLDGFANSS